MHPTHTYIINVLQVNTVGNLISVRGRQDCQSIVDSDNLLLLCVELCQRFLQRSYLLL